MASMKRTKPVAPKSTAKKQANDAADTSAPLGNAPILSSPAAAVSRPSAQSLRVRMFRVGFGDFFLLTVPTSAGMRHILIDCGVHAKDLKTIRSAVTQMASDCGSKLALIIMTHRHADHISGFATCSDRFSQIAVDRVWMP